MFSKLRNQPVTSKIKKTSLLGLAIAGLTVLPAGAAEENRASRWFQKVDADANGAITLREFLKKRGQQFTRLDLNRDGSLSPTEYTITESSARWFSKLDLNHDGGIRFDEYLSPSRLRFQQLDDNRDGRISENDLDRFRKKMRDQYAQRKRHAAYSAPSSFRLTKLARLDDKK